MSQIIEIFFFINIAIQYFFWGVVSGHLVWLTPKQKKVSDKISDKVSDIGTGYAPISVVICAKNEAENLAAYLPKILAQDYPDYEVIVVNDVSTDETAVVLQKLKAQFPTLLRVVTIATDEDRDLQGKKFALTKGITAVQFDWVLVTDADCYPIGNQWIKSMFAQSQAHEIVLGVSPYSFESGFLNTWIRFEAIYTALLYLSAALWRVPYMGVGRNLLYRKNLFVQNNGFATHGKVASGDDDLFMRDVANGKNTTICVDKNSFMVSRPKINWRDYIAQKQRHYSTAPHYKFTIIAILGIFSASQILFWLYFLLLPVLPFSIVFFIAARLLIFAVVIDRTARLLQNKIPLYWLPILDFCLAFYFVFFALRGSGKKNKW